MTERNLDFDAIIDRRGTYSMKYGFAENHLGESPADLLPLWIADMDFKTSSCVQDALHKLAEHGLFGYSETDEDYFSSVKRFYLRHHRLEIPDSSCMVKTPGVMPMLAMAVNAFSEKGDSILIQEPVYMHFAGLIRDSGRTVVSSDLVYGEEGRYRIDFDDFERKISESRPKLFFLCNPHNPVGRTWTRGELLQLAEICRRNRVIIVSDEIHGDFIFEGEHIPVATLSPEISDITLTVTSPTKTFNLAGLQIAHTFISNPGLRQAIQRELSAVAYGEVSTPGIVAAKAAYDNGEEWLSAMLEYVRGNIDFAKSYTQDFLPGVKLTPMEATYLAWFDFNGTGKTPREIDDLILHKARLRLNSGLRFGKSGAGFERLNLACPRRVLQEALERVRRALETA